MPIISDPNPTSDTQYLCCPHLGEIAIHTHHLPEGAKIMSLTERDILLLCPICAAIVRGHILTDVIQVKTHAIP
jgi:hypothetical protein